ncbi:hypothetical protein RO3G_16829 [Lichtheimia corymbifera JMRC:FSU:9682]|uniref:Transposase n=1 Tax=Lichtheimia corymbifera JMRC:FSU:9682 TaxID=1263082 RepID=A0A068SIQ0_9FUNG|nr:hypothetical protein RO3G_16829 [Lichtheimia corymbifera JMRC:FSU:9682]
MRQISIQKKNDILARLRHNETVRQVAEATQVSRGVVGELRKTIAHELHRNVGGRGRAIDTNLGRRIIRGISTGEYKNAADASRKLAASDSESKKPSAETIRRHLRDSGCRSRKKPKVTPLNAKRRKARLDFALAHRGWTIEDWKHVIFSDETKINRFGSDGAQWTWTCADGILRDTNVQHTYKHGGGSLMVWGCFSWHGIGFMSKIDGRMDADLYCSILSDELLQTLEWYNLSKDDIIFQQDNDPKHTSNKAKKWFEDNAVNVMKWPAYSPDINPIENLWAIVKRKLNEYDEAPASMRELWERVEYVWEHSITPELCKKLIESMPKRMEKLYKAKGGHINY